MDDIEKLKRKYLKELIEDGGRKDRYLTLANKDYVDSLIYGLTILETIND